MGHLQEVFNLLYSVKSNWELGMLKIASDVSWLGVATSRLSHSIRSFLPNWLYSSSGKVSRSLRSLLRFLFLFFTWTAAWEKNLTMDNLRKCSICIVDWCCMCKNSGDWGDYRLSTTLLCLCDWYMVYGVLSVWDSVDNAWEDNECLLDKVLGDITLLMYGGPFLSVLCALSW